MKIFYINNEGGGFADHVEIEEQTTVGGFFNEQLPDQKPENYLIRVNNLDRTRVFLERVIET